MITVRKSQVLRAITSILVSVILFQNTQGKIIYVDDDAIGANNGINWIDAYVSLQDALTDANDSLKPIEICVAQGIYTPDQGNEYVPGDKQATFRLKNGITLKGGFAGTGSDNPDAWDCFAYETILSGYLTNNTKSERVIWCVDANETAVLDGFTITKGDNRNGAGGGMFNERANPMVLRCKFIDNYASGGGGMGNDFSNPTVIDCIFRGNRSSMGGGMYNHESQPIIESCVFDDNQRGMYSIESSPTLINCLFINNEASWGAGMHTWKGSPTLINCTFSNNHARSWGAGMNNEMDGHAIVTNCIFWGNTPDQIKTLGGGMFSRFEMDVTFSDIQGGHTGEGNIDVDPLFANPEARDYHLKSQAGRWDPESERWVIDLESSPCIDAGDPNNSIVAEPVPNGGIINMGVYGGTIEASKSTFGLYDKYSAGTGEPNNPYQIATLEDLILLGESPEDYDKHFIMIDDVDLNPNLPGRKVFDRAVIGSFTGVFDGNGHTISHLTIEGVSFLGLFGALNDGGTISDLSVEAVDVNGIRECVGGLVGINYGNVTDCHSTGTVKGDTYIGGLVGQNCGSITTSYSTGKVTQLYTNPEIVNYDVGGLVGYNTYSGNIATSYSTSMVSGNVGVGGLVGCNLGYVTHCYSIGPVAGRDYVGGLVGRSQWWRGDAAIPFHEGTVMRCFWDTQTSGQTTSAGGMGLITAEMQTAGTFLEACWDFVNETENGTEDIWWILDSFYYPKFSWEPRSYSSGTGEPNNPYQISSVADLILLSEAPEDNDKHFILTSDLDLDPKLPGRKVFDRAVIGYFDWAIGEGSFTGIFDGNGHIISNLMIDGNNSLGLFGRLEKGAKVRNLGLVGIDIIGSSGNIGALSGWNYQGEISNCYSTGTITGSDKVGGLVGYNYTGSNTGSITGCYSACTVTGTREFLCFVGGLVGFNDLGKIAGCYSTGTVVGREYLGGLVGRNMHGSSIDTSYSTATVNGTGSYIGGLVGDNYGGIVGSSIIIASYSTGTVSGGNSVGGLVGRNWGGSITTSYSNAMVSARSNVGGFVGENRNGSIDMSYSTSIVSATGSNIGGFLGQDRNGTVVTSFWDIEVSGQTTSTAGTGLMTDKMQAADTFLDASWDFVNEVKNGSDDIWWINEGQDYPRLWWELIPEN